MLFTAMHSFYKSFALTSLFVAGFFGINPVRANTLPTLLPGIGGGYRGQFYLAECNINTNYPCDATPSDTLRWTSGSTEWKIDPVTFKAYGSYYNNNNQTFSVVDLETGEQQEQYWSRIDGVLEIPGPLYGNKWEAKYGAIDGGFNIEQLDEHVDDNATGISQNVSNILNNTADIENNSLNISLNASQIQGNLSNISNNSSGISQNEANIQSNATEIGTNSANILSNTNSIDRNIFEIDENRNSINSLEMNYVEISGQELPKIQANALAIETSAANILSNTNSIDRNIFEIDENRNSINSLEMNYVEISGQELPKIQANALAIETSAANILSNTNSIDRNIFDITENRRLIDDAGLEIVFNSTDISQNSSNIAQNRSEIQANSSAIETNATDIATAAAGVTDNASAIESNASAIDANASDIRSNASKVATNKKNITKNKRSIKSNASNVSKNKKNITRNRQTIKSNALSIEGNSSEIESLFERINNPNTAQVRANGLSVRGRNLIEVSDGVTSIGENSVKFQEDNGIEQMWAEDKDDNIIDINIAKGSDLLINGNSVQGQINDNRSAITSNRNNINSLGEGVAASTALSSALTALPTVSADSQLTCGVGTGTYSGATALALGCASRINDRLSMNIGGSKVFQGSSNYEYGSGSLDSYSARAGLVMKLGKIHDSSASKQKLQARLEQVERENTELHERYSVIEQQNNLIRNQNQQLMARLERLEAIALGLHSKAGQLAVVPRSVAE